MTTFSAPDVSAISPPKLSPFPVPDAKDVCVDDDGAIDQSRMLASPKLSIPTGEGTGRARASCSRICAGGRRSSSSSWPSAAA